MRGYGSSREDMRDLVRKDQDRERVRRLLLDGLESGPGEPVDANYFDELRRSIAQRAG